MSLACDISADVGIGTITSRMSVLSPYSKANNAFPFPNFETKHYSVVYIIH